MPRADRLLLALVGALLLGACGTPSRRLPVRQVDDPITLPDRMFRLNVGAGVTPKNVSRQREWSGNLWFAYGLTDRLTLHGLTVLEYALLDDAPAEWAATRERAASSKLGLSVTGGLAGLGYSSIEGMIVWPTAGVLARKRLSRSIRVDVDASWIGHLSRSADSSTVSGSVSGTVQLVDRLAMRLAVFDELAFSTFAPSTSWSEHSLGSSLSFDYRAFHWLNAGLGVRLTGVTWPASFPWLPPPRPDDPVSQYPRPYRFPIWWAVAWLEFRW